MGPFLLAKHGFTPARPRNPSDQWPLPTRSRGPLGRGAHGTLFQPPGGLSIMSPVFRVPAGSPRTNPFLVGVTRDFLKPDGTIGFGDIGLGLLEEAPGVAWEVLAEDTREVGDGQGRGRRWDR